MAFRRAVYDFPSTIRKIVVVMQRGDRNRQCEKLLAALVQDMQVGCYTLGFGIGEGDVESLERCRKVVEEAGVRGWASEAEVEEPGQNGEHEEQIRRRKSGR